MIAYKVVVKEKDKLYSAIQHKLSHGVHYKLNEKTIPNENCGPLCAFDSIENVKKFFTTLHDCQTIDGIISCCFHVFECEIEESQLDRVWDGYGTSYKTKSTKDFSYYSLPKGTVLCDSITLLKEIHLDE